MIDVGAVLDAVPALSKFCSVAELHELVQSLDRSRFCVKVAGSSDRDVPIHHVSFGRGSVKAIFVAFVDPDEPMGGLSVFSLLTLLSEGHTTLTDADVEWHIVPCVDPDGAVLNEGWTQEPFSLRNYMKYCFKQTPGQRVETTFPVMHKLLKFDRPPTREAKVLMGILDAVRPDFYYPLHNSFAGGAYFFIGRDISDKYYRALHELVEQHGIQLQRNAWHGFYCAQLADGIYELGTVKKLYDAYEKTTPFPERALANVGATSAEYLGDIKPSAMSFVSEFTHLRHPSEGSRKETGIDLRRLKLQADADNKYLASVILEEWEKVEADIDRTSPFYQGAADFIAAASERLEEGGVPISLVPTRELMFNPQYDGTATEGNRFDVYMADRFGVIRYRNEFVRLLQASPQTPAVREAAVRIDAVLEQALDDIGAQIDFDAFDLVAPDVLARLQLASGLIVLNSVLEDRP